jgi:endonuclease YncB( thermonuclease family)
MRQYLYVLAALVAAAGFAIGAALVRLDRPAPASRPVAASPGTSEPAAPGKATAAESRQASDAASPSAAPVGPPAPPQVAVGAPADKPPASDLPTVDVAPRTVHTVPDSEPPAASVTIVDRNGRTVKEINPSAGLSPTYVPSVGPGAAATASRGTARPVPVPAPAPGARLASLPPGTGTSFDGKGSARGGTMIAVSGRDVRLFGVRLAEARDKCGLGPGDNRSCSDVARDALAQRLKRYPDVACRVPPGQRGDQVAVCTDSSGTDLGGFLIAEGYALADTNQSFDYFGAEGVARSYRRGLWRYR